jgi:hypothetical protein
MRWNTRLTGTGLSDRRRRWHPRLSWIRMLRRPLPDALLRHACGPARWRLRRPRLLRHGLLRHRRLTGPTTGRGRLRSHGLRPRIHRRLLRRLRRPAALLWRAMLRRQTGLSRPTADRRGLLRRCAGLRILLPPRICRLLRCLGLAGPDARHLLRHALLRLCAWLRIGLHRARHLTWLGPSGLLRHDRLLRSARQAGPASLLRRSKGDNAKQADRLPPALRTTEGLSGPLNLIAAVRTAECVH